jgi:hypothetical protein
VLSARIRLIGQDVQNSPAKIAYEKWTEDTEANVPVVVTDREILRQILYLLDKLKRKKRP